MTPDPTPPGQPAGPLTKLAQRLRLFIIDLDREAKPDGAGPGSLSEIGKDIQADFDRAVTLLPDGQQESLEHLRTWFSEHVLTPLYRIKEGIEKDPATGPAAREKLAELAKIDVPAVIQAIERRAAPAADAADDPAPPAPPLPVPAPPGEGPPRAAVSDPPPVSRAIVLLDLAQFTLKVGILTNSLDDPKDDAARLRVVDYLQSRIEYVVHKALARTGFSSSEFSPVFCDLGDGGLLEFLTVKRAYDFVAALGEVTHARNDRITGDELDRVLFFHFRVGLSYGLVRFRTALFLKPNPDRPYTVSVGEPLVWAQRLCSQCRTGQVLMHGAACERLIAEEGRLPDGFTPAPPVDPELVPGKKGEEPYPARRRQIIPRADWDSA